ncbi:zinc finger protein 493-like [Schistocerca nitens]|uniref:zinc finger protein 493-like n=1 Tax=Schistocerca nitens TaxID=7011 RepID=UPI0021193AA2|nr:zinc finger protein 493-like [Schistocerca nitens]
MEAVQEVSLGAMLDAGDGAVVALVAGDTRLVAHRAVLAARSPVIADMFRHGAPEASSGQLTVPDVEGPVLQELLGYLYTLQAPQLPSMAHQLLAAADSYGVSVLKAECEQQVAAQLSIETAAATAVLAIRHSADSLKQAAVAFIKAHLVSVMATQGWADAMHSQPEDLIEVCRLVSDPPVEARLRKNIVELGNTLLEETWLQELTADNPKIIADESAHFAGNSVETHVFCTPEKRSYATNICNLEEKEYQDFGCSSRKQSFSSDKKLNTDGVQSTAHNCTLSDEVSLSHSSFSTHCVTMRGISKKEDQCGKITDKLRRNQSHEIMCADEGPHKFHSSTKSFTTTDNLSPQRSVVSEKSVTESNLLKKPTLVQDSEEIKKCEVYGKSINQSYNPKTSKLTHTGESSHKCDVCGKSFSKSFHLKTHTLSHTGKNLHKCDVCGKCFTRSDNLKVHLRTHTGYRPHKCKVCGKSFTRSCSLKKHCLIHIGKKPYQCDVCGKCFTQSAHLQLHTLSHTDQKVYLCDVCGKSYARPNVFKSHLLIHHKE